jgi:hypothetical protein
MSKRNFYFETEGVPINSNDDVAKPPCNEDFILKSIAGPWTQLINNVQGWSPRMSFILNGYQIPALRLEGSFKSKTSI